ncbi:MAG: PEP-utilizing enzyme [Patescibacteria group bacterium]
MREKRRKKIKWEFFGERQDPKIFNLLFFHNFIIGHFKYLGFKNFLYVNDYPKIVAYRDEEELKKLYKKIKNFKKSDFVKVAQETKKITDHLDFWLKEFTSKDLEQKSDIELKNYFNELSELLYKFLSFFILVQYIGRALPGEKKILKFFDKKTLETIRVSPILLKINEKLRIYFNILSKRFYLKPPLFFWASPKEIEGLFTRRKINIQKFAKTLKERKRYNVLISRNKRICIYLGSKANAILNRELGGRKIKFDDISVLRGQRVYSRGGKIRGGVKVVLSKGDFKKVEKGDILVVVTTMPDYLPVLKKVKAIIGDEGGLLSHTSVIARELKIPCIIGTKNATRIIKDGDLVEVDANRGIVKILKRK